MAQAQQQQQEQGSKAPLIILIVLLSLGAVVGLYFVLKPSTTTKTPAQLAAEKAAADRQAAIDKQPDAVPDPNSPTGYVDSEGNIVNKDGTDYIGDATYINTALAAFSKKLGWS